MVRLEQPLELNGIRVDESQLSLTHLSETYKNVEHQGVTCDGCNKSPIVGIRFKCDVCLNHNLCSDCIENNDHPTVVLIETKSEKIDPDSLTLLNEVGRGAFSTVNLAVFKSSTKGVACKKISIDKSILSIEDQNNIYKKYCNELKLHLSIQGENLIKIFGYALVKTDEKINLMIATEYMQHGSLDHLLKYDPHISFRARLDIAFDIAAGLSRIHDVGLIHHDVRPDNIFITKEYRAKLGSPHISKFIPKDKLSEKKLFYQYMPSEFETGKYNQLIDVYAYGLTLNELFGGTIAKSGESKIENKATIMSEFVDKCTQVNPKNRATIKYIYENISFLQDALTKILFREHPAWQCYSMYEKNDIFRQVYTKVLDRLKQQGF